jgi:hypothetical protein
LNLALLEIDQQAGRAVMQMPAGDVVFKRDQRMRWVREVM